ncbi:DUF1269 domain-containing protein [Lichenihabitans psoromatis]|uniref:DUF1269 domain-containing protein n=1 Tax=Lichenihabitans psoromatis TaxID=2528642 RepID=UPI001038499B|nr:DUF1269 domain-containing protein [Lichenihabitans psoromatis]
MAQNESMVAVYLTHEAAEEAIRKIADAGLSMSHFSIVGKGYHTDEQVIGFYSAGDRISFWGSRAAYWGGLWGLLFGGIMFTVPVIGPVVVLGHLATAVFAALSGAVEGAILSGGVGALGAALFSIGIPHHSVLQYEQHLRADAYLVVAHGPAAEVAQAKTLLQLIGPTQIDVHTAPQSTADIAA